MNTKTDWKARLAAKRAELEEVKASISAEEREEIDGRAEEEELEEKIRDALREKRELSLDRRVEAMKEALGPDSHIEGLAIQDRDDTFVVAHDGKAHATFVRRLNSNGKKIDPVAIYLDYAIAVIADWNGITDFDATSTNGPALRRFLERNPGIATSVTNVGTRLAGAHAEARKS